MDRNTADMADTDSRAGAFLKLIVSEKSAKVKEGGFGLRVLDLKPRMVHWSLVTGHWSLVIGHLSLAATRCTASAARCLLPAACFVIGCFVMGCLDCSLQTADP